MKVLLVGESNPHSADPEFALFPVPGGAAGDRLRRIFGYSVKRYLRDFDRANLLPSGVKWSAKDAKKVAGGLTHKKRVLLGSRVCAAHDVLFEPFKRFTGARLDVLILPHPSGRCRVWNDRRAISKARRALGEFLAG